MYIYIYIYKNTANDRMHIRELTWPCKTRLVSISAFDKYLALFCHNWCLETLISNT